MKSTVPVGTGERSGRASTRAGSTNVGYVSNPEFLAEGTALRTSSQPDRIVVGAFDEPDAGRVAGAARRTGRAHRADATSPLRR